MGVDFRGLETVDNFILWDLRYSKKRGEWVKMPLHYETGLPCDPGRPENRTDAETAVAAARATGTSVGFYFTPDDPFFFIDIDNAFEPDGTMRPDCREVVAWFDGAFVETSQSGNGLHIIGSCDMKQLPPNRRCKSDKHDLSFDSLWTEGRFVALTMRDPKGSALRELTWRTTEFMHKKLMEGEADERSVDWTSEPIEGPGLGDVEILERASKSESVAGSFGHAVRFIDLWNGDAEVLGNFWPDVHGRREYDASKADASLAQHLAFWTGGNCEQIERLMRMSGLHRSKWDDREEYYLPRTILRAVARQKNFYSGSNVHQLYKEASAGSAVVVPPPPRSSPVAPGGGEADHRTRQTLQLVPPPPPAPSRDREPLPMPVTVQYEVAKPELIEGPRFMTAREQLDYFDGCVYVAHEHRVLTDSGELMKPDAFRAHYGGYMFEIKSESKSTDNAFKAFTESQLVKFPKARKTFFDPTLPARAMIDGKVNTYVPVEVEAVEGDVTPFMQHMERLLPVESDREILLDYLAACVQRPGDKFQWCPLIQGVEGNGKTLLGAILRNAIGKKYFHQQDPDDVSNVFNRWLEETIVVCVEEIFINTRYEMSNRMKAMITNDYLPIQGKGADQYSNDNCAKFILFSNHKDGVYKHANDRRYAIFYTAQQEFADKIRDGMHGNYFRKLHRWIKSREGQAAMNWFLINREISTDMMADAPLTSSTQEAVFECLGPEERIIHEAMESEEIGLRKGIIACPYVDDILRQNGYKRMNPKKRNTILKNLGYRPMESRVRIGDRKMQLYLPLASPLRDQPPTKIRELYLKYNHADSSGQ